MTDTKLTGLLRALSTDEMKQLEKFVDSPFHNSGRDLTSLVRFMRSIHPAFEEAELTNELIYGKIFPGKKYDGKKSDNLIRTLTSHLFRMCKEFLVQAELKAQSETKKYMLLNQLRKRGLYREFDKDYENVIQPEDRLSRGSIGSFVTSYFMNAVKRDCSLNRDDFSNAFEFTMRASEDILTAALISCFKFEDEKNLAEVYNAKARSSILHVMLDSIDYEKFLQRLKKEDPERYPYINIFYHVYMMNKDKTGNSYYFRLKELVTEHASLFGVAENYVLWNILLTRSQLSKMGNAEVFSIHKYMVKNGVYKISEKENFHIVLFRNIVIVASSLGEYEWLGKFIEKYSGELQDNHRENMKLYSLAYLHYAKSEFDKALEHILKVKYNLFLFKLDLRILQLKTYYELEYYEEALSLAASSLSYISSATDLSPVIKTHIGNFIKCVRDLIKYKTDTKLRTEGPEELRKKISGNLYSNLMEWYLRKLDEAERMKK
jgi:hypothetical protein